MVNVREALREAIAHLREANVPSDALTAELLLMHTLGRGRVWIYAHPEALLGEDAAAGFFERVAQRAKGTPTQYLTGKQEFWGLEFEVSPAVLIPRPETEHLIEVALERLGEARRDNALRVADAGTGSGCIAVTLASELPHAEIWATDISSAALEVARRNALRHGVAERIHFVECNWLRGILGGANERQQGSATFDLIASNPPYISHGDTPALAREILEHEPHTALFGGASGTEIYAPLIAQAAALLKSGGLLIMEIGFGAAEGVRGAIERSGPWEEIRVANDLARIPRVISGKRV